MEASKEVQTEPAFFAFMSMPLVYDPVVLGISNTFIWKCPTSRLVRMYDELVSANHLDVGVGTGYFVSHCRFPSPTPRLGLMDLSPQSLKHASRRTARYKPETYQHDVLKPVPFNVPKFDTIAMNYVLQIIPGALEEKAVAFDHLRVLLNPGGRFFGAAILQDLPHSRLAQRLLKAYNRKRLFHTERDTLEGLERALKQRFRESQVTVVGSVALFQATS